MSDNTNADIQEGEIFNANRDVIKMVINSGPDITEILRDALPSLLEEIKKIQFPHGQTRTDDFPSEGGSQLEKEPVTIERVESSPSSSTRSVADIYTRSMLKCLSDYPLYDPQPYSDLSEEYMRKGVRVGDVGIMTKDGAFEFLFNVCPSQNALINPRNLPSDFTLEISEDPEINHKEQFPRETHIFESQVRRINNLFQGPRYTSSEVGGAILELPEGASQDDATSTFTLRRLASRCAEQWYKYAIGTRGKDILNGSLHLVTSCTKCTQWGIAIFDLPCTSQDNLRFVQNKGLFRSSGSKYSWKGSKPYTTKISPNMGPNNPNQCVLVNGYTIKLHQDIFNDLRNDLLRPTPQASSSSLPFGLGSRLSQHRVPVRRDTGDSGQYRPQNRQQNFDHSPAKNNDHGITIETEAPFIIPEYPSVDRGGEDAQNREAGYGVDPDLSIPQGAPTITTKPNSVNQEDRVVQRGDAPSMSVLSNVEITGSNFYEVPDGQFTDVQRNSICDYIANRAEFLDIESNPRRHVLPQPTTILPLAEAKFNDYQTKNNGPCLQGTRVALLREMAGWFIDPDGSSMFVLSGLAGTGKSTVAYTIASRAADLDLLGASFFFEQDGADCNNAKIFFTTIAYQLCVYDETFAKAIGDVLDTERGSAATTSGPQEQLQVLILEPLRSIVQSRIRPIFVVIDGLDECAEDDGRAVVKGLSQLILELPIFKVILATRPQPSLNRFFSSQGDYTIYHLQDIDNKVVDGDIQFYLKHYLSLLQIQKHYPERQWCASDEEIESLVRASRRLFIIASKAVRYILDKSASDPAAQMQKLLHDIAQGRMLFEDVNEDFDMNFGGVVFGWGTMLGILIAILVHQR